MPKASYSSSIALPELPTTENPEIYGAVLPLYNAISSLAANLDVSTGRQVVPADEYQYQQDTEFLLVGNMASVYRQCGGAISAGQTVRFALSGGVSKAFTGTAGTVVAFSLGNYASGEWGHFQLTGYYPASGLTIGSIYSAHPTTAGSLLLSTGLTSGQTNQPVMRAISATVAYFNPSLLTSVVP